jgi:Restriction endonuclease S subunits
MVDPLSGEYNELPHIGPGNIETFSCRLYDNINTVKEDNLISGKFHFNKGDIIYGKINPQLRKYVFAPFEGLASADTYILNAKNRLEQTFLFTLLQSQHFFKYSVSVSMRSGMPKINRSELNEYRFNAPSVREQKFIGELFLIFDNLITLHKRKLDLLKQIKQGYLQQMFPKNGENVPRLRFANFEVDWEQRKIREIFNVTRGQVLTTKATVVTQTEEMCYPVYSSQTKNNGLMGYYNDFLFDTAITWTTDGANAGTVQYRIGKFYSTNVNGVLISDEGYSNTAVAEIINRIAWKYVSKVGNPKLMNNVMGNIILLLPISIKEQNIISNLLEKINQLIMFQQQYIEFLNALKKFYLQKMFI